MSRRAQLLLCLALTARVGWAQNTSNSSNSSSNATSSPPPPPPVSSTPTPPSPPANTAPSGAGVVTSEQLWKLRDNQCGRACVAASDITLNWCADQIPQSSYVCNRTADGDSDWSVARIEEAAQAAYNAIEFGLNTPPSTDCKRYLHQWVCWQFFTQCGSDKRKLRPICKSSCHALSTTCVIGWLDCDIEVEELRGTAPPWWFDQSGAYIRGVKPANDSVPLASRRAVTLQDNGVLGQGNVYGLPTEFCTGAGAHATPAPALLLLVAARVVGSALWHDRQD